MEEDPFAGLEPRVENEPDDLIGRLSEQQQQRLLESQLWRLICSHIGESVPEGLPIRRWLPREARNLAKTALYAHRPPLEPVLVVSPYGRSGSSLFVDYLQDLIAMRWEVLNSQIPEGLRPSAGRVTALRHISASLGRTRQSPAGCKLHLNQMARHGVTFADLRRRLPTARFVVVYRQSIFRQYLSSRVAKETGRWDSRGGAFTETIRLDADTVAAFIQEYREVHRLLASILPDGLFVSYEDLVADPQVMFRERVCPFIGCAYRPVSTPLQRRIRKPPHEVVENWDEVVHLADEMVEL